jgi:glycosyltransferase involved in cell wall biosynthesis
LLCRRRDREATRETTDGVQLRRSRGTIGNKKIPLLLAAALPWNRRARFDLVMERFDTFGGAGAIYSRLTGTPLCLEVNYPHLDEMIWKWRRAGKAIGACRPLHRVLRRWNQWQYSAAALIVAPRKSIIPPAYRRRTRHVHWGADPEHFRPAALCGASRPQRKTQLGLKGASVVLAHGSFQPWHGVRLFPDIVRKVVAARKDAVFVFVGQGHGVARIQSRLQTAGLLSNCRFTGRVDYRDLPCYLNAADIALSPFSSRDYEPLITFGFFWSPAKIFEYMASGLPVVTTDQPYLKRVVEGEGAGVCVRQEDSAAIARAVLDLLGHPQRGLQMGRAGREAVLRKFSWQSHVRDLEEHYCSTVTPGAGSRYDSRMHR